MNEQVQKKLNELIPDKDEQERFIDFAVSVGLHMMDKGFSLPERWGLAVGKLSKADVFAVSVTPLTLSQQADLIQQADAQTVGAK